MLILRKGLRTVYFLEIFFFIVSLLAIGNENNANFNGLKAHVRGHQVRKQYRAIIWSVGILEKIILRWRRKGSGLRGFRNDAVIKDSQPDPQHMPLKDDDYDFFKEGRKQTEERLQSALTRVKSMVQYPEGRAQYRRLLNVVDGFRETKVLLLDFINITFCFTDLFSQL